MLFRILDYLASNPHTRLSWALVFLNCLQLKKTELQFLGSLEEKIWSWRVARPSPAAPAKCSCPLTLFSLFFYYDHLFKLYVPFLAFEKLCCPVTENSQHL